MSSWGLHEAFPYLSYLENFPNPEMSWLCSNICAPEKLTASQGYKLHEKNFQ